jgi:multicomponent K+:H+ antiporter subunit A
MPDALLLIALVALPFAGAVAAGLLPTHARNTASALAGGIALVCLMLVWTAYPTVSAGGVLRAEFPWIPALGLNVSLRMDGFAWLFAGLVTGIAALVMLYARYYMSEDDPVPRFFAFLLAFMGR